jgi:hypothetical protein
VTCSAKNIVVTLGPGIGFLPPWGEVDVQCELPESFLEVVMDMPDVRALGVGSYPISAESLALFIQNTSCRSTMSSGSATLVVTRAEGGPAPYPAEVTGDYLREFSVHIEAQALPSSTPNGCVAPTATATVDLEFAGTAADAVNHPDATCLCG